MITRTRYTRKTHHLFLFLLLLQVAQLCLTEMLASKGEQDKHLACQGVVQYAARQLSSVLVESRTKNASSSTLIIYLY